MKDSSSARLAGPDHLRALAIILVFLYHYRLFQHPAWVESMGSFGWTGVDLFFVLSGYLIATQLFRSLAEKGRLSLKEFYQKRFLRIIPAYVFVLGLYFLFPVLREWEGLSPLWKFATFTQNFGLDLSRYRTFSHAWSLCVEEQFYFLFPLMILVFHRLRLGKWSFLVIFVLFAMGFFLRAYEWTSIISGQNYQKAWYRWIYYPTYNRLDGLLVGITIAALFRFLPDVQKRIIRYGNQLLLLAGALLTCAYFLCIDPFSFRATVYGFPLVALAYGVLLVSVLSPGSVFYRFRSRISFTIAEWSYSIYLTHKMAIHLVQALLPRFGVDTESTFAFWCCAVFSLLAAFLLHRIVERPFLRIKEALSCKSREGVFQNVNKAYKDHEI